jgi:hypothetical protein
MFHLFALLGKYDHSGGGGQVTPLPPLADAHDYETVKNFLNCWFRIDARERGETQYCPLKQFMKGHKNSIKHENMDPLDFLTTSTTHLNELGGLGKLWNIGKRSQILDMKIIFLYIYIHLGLD